MKQAGNGGKTKQRALMAHLNTVAVISWQRHNSLAGKWLPLHPIIAGDTNHPKTKKFKKPEDD
jgi:hypothetical protein